MMKFRERMATDEMLLGVIVTMSLPSVSEVLSKCGFDWLWVDMEHAPLSLREVEEVARVKDDQCAVFVRIPENTDEWIKRVLDLGVEGIILPHLNTREEAERAVKASYYPPEGTRSIGLMRASCYGMNVAYKHEANAKRLVFGQIEHREGVENIESILQVAGLDAIIIGPHDLSGSYGKLGEIHDPEVVDAIKRTVDACKRFQKPIGIFAKHAEDAKQYLEQGFQLVALGVDIRYLWNAAKDTLDLVKDLPIKR
jgi:2-keto-3-deoxy-L-rhamnonate aldolase RhmA